MRIKLTNLNPIDVMVDVNGKGNVEDKTLVHPRTTAELTIDQSVYPVVKGMAGVRVQVITKD
ncbi:hypothetical protein [Ralstonia phage RP13]|nr:hypothetical protein [Ralstonia phage RP13]